MIKPNQSINNRLIIDQILERRHSPTQTRPSRPTARPAIHSHLKDPSVFTQRPFIQIPGVSHSSMSGRETEETGGEQGRQEENRGDRRRTGETLYHIQI